MEPLENNDTVEPKRNSRWAGLGTRIASSAILIGVFIGALWMGGWLFCWLVLMAGLMMMREWNALTKTEGPLWRLAGMFYVSIPCASLIWLRGIHIDGNPNAGLQEVLFIMLAVWATDIGAYFTGRKVGGPKLAPDISPSKTWAGLGGGIGAAATTTGLSHFFIPYPSSFILAIAFGILIAILGQVGDLFESWLKRRAGVKDSGTLIPGHGGLLDRIDGLIFTLPLFAWLVYLGLPV